MTNTSLLVCDGCGQAATSEHIAKRLLRLEWSTRYRPVHINTILLAGVSPSRDEEFFYSPSGQFAGEAANWLKVAGITVHDKAAEMVHAEFQRSGYFLTYILECPIENAQSVEISELLAGRIPAVLARIRRSLKPKQVALVSKEIAPFIEKFISAGLESALLLNAGKPFDFANTSGSELSQLREALKSGSGTH